MHNFRNDAADAEYAIAETVNARPQIMSLITEAEDRAERIYGNGNASYRRMAELVRSVETIRRAVLRIDQAIDNMGSI